MLNGNLSVDWTSQLPAPNALLLFVSCGCSGKCTNTHCSCSTNHLQCTDACWCDEKCENRKCNGSSDDEDDEDEDEGENDEDDV